MTEIYIVYLYCDYRKEVDLQHLCSFKRKDAAINFAKQYCNEEKTLSEKYVLIKGTEYDSELYYFNVGQYRETHDISDEEAEILTKKYKQMTQDLKIKSTMWYTRIAVDKVNLIM